MEPRERLAFAMDVPNRNEAERFVKALKDDIGCFKIGLQLFISEGPDIIRLVQDHSDAAVFLDLKLHDIPATVRNAVEAAVKHNVQYLTVHCGSGQDMLRAAVRGAAGSDLKILAVTVLTSAGPEDIGGIEQGAQELQLANLVIERAHKARVSGCHGVVCSGLEVAHVKKAMRGQGITVVPGIRPAWACVDQDDQARIVTPKQAIQDGADMLVVGRPIRDADDPRAAARRVVEEIAGT